LLDKKAAPRHDARLRHAGAGARRARSNIFQGREMATRHDHQRLAITLALLSAAALGALLGAAAPGVAQTAPAINSTATPAPADPGLIGPPQLRDFNLNGTVTQRAEPATPAPRTTAPPRAAPAPSASIPAARTSPAPQRTSTAPAAQPVRTTPSVAALDRDAAASRVTVALPPPTPADTGAASSFSEIAPTAAPTLASTSDEQQPFPWAWVLAAIVAALGAGFVVWRRKQAGAARYATGDQGISELVAQPATRVPASRPTPPPPRAPQPAPPRAPPRAPQPAPPRPAVARAPVEPSLGIVATRLRPKLAFELRPIRAETDAHSGAAVLFDVIVTNSGSAPARDVLVEAQLINAGPRQDEEIGRFFREPVGQGERLAVIPPMGRISIKTRLTISPEQMRPIELEGRRLFVPLIAFNALYRWSGGEDQDSASFLVGRGSDDSVKMAPFRLDQGARSWTGLGARPHSMGLSS